MKVFILITTIFSCILRKKQHCVDNFILKDRIFPESVFEQLNENEGSLSTEKTIKRKIPVESSTNDLEIKQKKSCSSQMLLKKDFITYNDFSNKQVEVKDLNNTQKFNQKDDVYIQKRFNEINRLFLTDQMAKLYVKIEQYMRNHLLKTHINYYLSKLENIDQSNKFFIANVSKLKEVNSIFDPYHPKFNEILNFMFSKFNFTTEFKEEVCEIFIFKMFNKLCSDKDMMNFFIKLRAINIVSKKSIFFNEFLNCAKYFPVIPELMTLGGVVSDSSINDLIIVIHLTNLILNARKNVSEVKVFILFLIKKAFTSSVKKRLDLFSIQIHRTTCSEGQNDLHNHDLYFFLWEINNHKRGNIKKRTKNVSMLFLSESDRNHFRSVLLIFMYQHIIFLRYSNVSYEESKKYFQLINDIIELKNCPICDFSKFIELLKSFNEYNFEIKQKY